MSGHAVYVLGIFLAVSGSAGLAAGRIILHRKMKKWKEEYQDMYREGEL